MEEDISMYIKCAWKSDEDIINHFKKVIIDCRKSEKYYNKNCKNKIKNKIKKVI